MIRVIEGNDIDLLKKLFKRINRNDQEEFNNIVTHLIDTKILVGNVDGNKITSLLIANLIKNDYYLEDIIFFNDDLDEIRNVLRYMIDVLRNDERGLSIIYDNIPYSEIMHEILIEIGFKCHFINFETTKEHTLELIRSNIVINETTDDVSNYMLSHLEDEIKSIRKYIGEISKAPDVIDINKTNIAASKNREGKITGVLRFGLITDSIYINNIYADDKDTYLDLINLIKNLTNRKIEIGIYPVREDLLSVLSENGFKKSHSDYKYKF